MIRWLPNGSTAFLRRSGEGVMWVDCGERMTQSPPALLTWARPLRGRALTDRITLGRVRKTRTVRSLRAAAPRLGYRERQGQRWWATATTGGREALLRRR
jgi:hypothetical protein